MKATLLRPRRGRFGMSPSALLERRNDGAFVPIFTDRCAGLPADISQRQGSNCHLAIGKGYRWLDPHVRVIQGDGVALALQ